ncbi:hypothetical protein [Paenibacillus sp. JDR-2]|uniref:hypothetical protein n=1 Tax=Paenibacillus sp. (strain JDR-2) TaxID=324057 RepID=UPI0006743C7D|nr:hypothetical protein [Paenibacillus sp. JDR-2]
MTLDEDLTRRGYATWNIEYRRVGAAGGGWTGTFVDVIDAVNHLAQLEERYQLDLSRVVVLGHSAGAFGSLVHLVLLPEVEHFAIIDPSSAAWKAEKAI